MIELFILSFGLFIYFLTIALVEPYALGSDSIKNRLKRLATVTPKNISFDEELDKPLVERFVKPMLRRLFDNLKQIMPKGSNSSNEASNVKKAKLRAMLRQSGIKINVNDYLLIRGLSMAGAVLISVIYGIAASLSLSNTLLVMIIGIYAIFVLFRFQLSSKVTEKRNSMEKQLPEVLDMLSVSVEAGLGLEQAMIEVTNHFEGPLIDEIAVTNRELSMGRSRKDAFILLGDRCDFEEMKTFVRSIVQATQMGVSIKNVLNTQAAYMRQTRRNKIEEKAMKISVKILIPMTIFIFPVIFIILLAPAIINIADTLL